MAIILLFLDGTDEHRKGLLHMKMAEGAKLQMCYLLHHLCDIQLRHRVESIIAFSFQFVNDIQIVRKFFDKYYKTLIRSDNCLIFFVKDQLRRYNEIKQSDLPSAVAAKKTREFRCPPREQVCY